jgi:putative redox protein
MVEQFVEYIGDLHCKLTHGPSKSTFLTDAPVDNNGKGEYFSPTDLVSAALGSCILTTMGIVANRDKIDIDIDGTIIKVTKEMTTQSPRRIGKLTVDIYFPRKYDDKQLQILKNIANTCPVLKSLNPEIEIEMNYFFKE